MAFQRWVLQPAEYRKDAFTLTARTLPQFIIPQLRAVVDGQLACETLRLAAGGDSNIFINLTAVGSSNRFARELSSKFEADGYVVWEQGARRLEISIGGKDTTEPYTYRNFPTSDQLRMITFVAALDDTQPFAFEIWDETPTSAQLIGVNFGRSTATGGLVSNLFKPEPPTPPASFFWQEVMHDALQHLPNEEGTAPALRERVFPDVIPEGLDYTIPHVVWYETGPVQTTAVEGQMETGVRVTLDFRSPNRLEATKLRRRAISHLRNASIVDRVVNVTALYDFETKLRRELADVIIYPLIDPQRNPITRISPWGPQFGVEFG